MIRSPYDRLVRNFRDAADRVLSQVITSGDLIGVAAAAWAEDAEPYAAAFGDAATGEAMTTDTSVWIASMTKAVTGVAAMQLVERGAVTLDQPLGDLVPYLGSVQVLDGFDEHGTARLRPPKTPITLRRLLTHSAGFGYDWADPSLARFVAGQPAAEPGSTRSYELPLLFDPGTEWTYGVGIDWAGQVVEAVTGRRLDAVIADEICSPLAMRDTGFRRTAQQQQRAAAIHLRTDDGLVPMPFALPEEPEMLMGGGGLYSTVTDYLRFTRMILNGGELEGVRLLTNETVTAMAGNHLEKGTVAGWSTCNPILSNDVDLALDGPQGWGLSFLINEFASPQGRSAGSLSWAGLANSYYWIDRASGTTGVFATQVLPFYDPAARNAFQAFEVAVNGG